MPDVHAKLIQPSSLARTIGCPPSAKENAKVEDQSSPFAQEGTDAHSLCEYLLCKALGHPLRDPTESLSYYNEEMQDAAEGYRNFVLEQIEEIRKNCSDPFIGVEQRLDISRWIPECFGTGDCVIVGDGTLHIIDFKYGTGVRVDADHNPQLSAYALGAYDTFGALYDIDTVKLSIYQPRLSHVDTWETPLADLLDWASKTLLPATKAAIDGTGEYHPGDYCRFCKVAARCRALAEKNMAIAQYEFKEPDLLSDDEIAELLPQIDPLVSWATLVKNFALEQAVAGKHFNGYKLVEGRSNRKYTDENLVEQTVLAAGFDPYEKKLKGITAMTSELGRKKFNELLGDLVIKPTGKPVLVPEDDKRPELSTAADDFKMEDTL